MACNQRGGWRLRTPTREAGWKVLQNFVRSAGLAYASSRNIDFGPSCRSNVSTLSPYIRHRLVTESEVVAAVLERHSVVAAEKFIQEVCWRTYWKGWLEQHPQVWSAYLNDLMAARETLRNDTALAVGVAAAECGDTSVACFNTWARELAETGYLHNHARMWFASIWIFTLRLPWVLGADFFMRHLLDGDPASNTLSWRWVAGLHTQGKIYLARPDNVAAYTNERFKPGPDEFVAVATPLTDAAPLHHTPLRAADVIPNESRVVLLITEEDLSPETWPLDGAHICGAALYRPGYMGAAPSNLVQTFKKAAMVDALQRAAAIWNLPTSEVATARALAAFAQSCGANCAVTAMVPVGYLRPDFDALVGAAAESGYPVKQILRPWDSHFWPHAKAGFFSLSTRIPAVLTTLALNPGNK